MKRLQVAALSLALAMTTLGVFAPQAFADTPDNDSPELVQNENENDDEPEDIVEPGWVEEDGVFYFVQEDGSYAIGWLDYEGNRYWLGEDGARSQDCWVKIDETWYRFDGNGAMVSNTFMDINGARYYFMSDGTVLTGMMKIDGKVYYAGSDGKLYQNSWYNSGNAWYYFGNNYCRVENDYVSYNGAMYWLGSNGSVATGWINNNDTWHYAGTDGKLYKSQWLSYKGSWYYFGANNVMTTDAYIVYNKSVYWFGSDGKLVFGWFTHNGSYYYANASGQLVKNAWVNATNAVYYLGSNYSVDTSKGYFVKSGGYWYHKNANGSYTYGWLQVDGVWYYFNTSNGHMLTNQWLSYNSNYYYLGANGIMYTSRYTPDGYWVDAQGRRTGTATDSKAQGYSSATSYLILVDYTNHMVNIYNGSYGNWRNIKSFACSMGASGTPTPTGEYTVTSKVYSFGEYPSYTCYYASGFIGTTYLFHSVLYDWNTFNIQDGRLGLNISHGCIRLDINNAKWIYDNIPSGTKVVIYY